MQSYHIIVTNEDGHSTEFFVDAQSVTAALRKCADNPDLYCASN